MERGGRRAVAVDWSGAADSAAQRRRIWLAEADGGALLRLEAGRTRAEVVEELAGLAARATGAGRGAPGTTGTPVLAGLDLCFSFPAPFVERLGCRTAGEVWRRVARDGDRWLSECRPPFWGRPRRPRPARDARSEHRRTERRLAGSGSAGSRPKSVFQVGGAGSVGTASLRGMPHLAVLREAGWSVWPFDPPGRATLVEIYPRQLTGAVVKRRAEARRAFLAERSWWYPPRALRAMLASEDAFDAAVSALVMSAHPAAPERHPDPPLDRMDRLEGRVWAPGGRA